MDNEQVEYVLGTGVTQCQILEPFAESVVGFLHELSEALRGSVEAAAFADIMTLSFWCRRGNIQQLRKDFDDDILRIGLGRVFHIAPSNVPINFAFSYVFGLLSGNSNVVRLQSRDFRQVGIICETLANLFAGGNHPEIEQMTTFVKYGHADEITRYFSMESQARIIWGGDATVRHIRSFEMPERCVDIAFRDRYSLCVMDSDAWLTLEEPERRRVAEGFYNDTYLMDQNACSSPHLIFWVGHSLLQAQELFWGHLLEVVKAKYSLAPIHAVDKHYDICRLAIELAEIGTIKSHENLIHRVQLSELPDDVTALRGQFGLFFEYHATDLNGLEQVITDRFQTLTYFGVDRETFLKLYRSQRWRGVDRIVPIGRALDIGLIWDGYDIIQSLTRRVTIE